MFVRTTSKSIVNLANIRTISLRGTPAEGEEGWMLRTDGGINLAGGSAEECMAARDSIWRAITMNMPYVDLYVDADRRQRNGD